MIRLSVVVPFFNVAPYAAHTLHSLAANAAPDVEFVLVDDGSSDDTAQILAEQGSRLPGATLISLEPNRGLSAARNAGLATARGRYLTFLDGDDVVAPGHYAQLSAAIESLECDFVRTDHVQVRGRDRIVHRIAQGPRRRRLPADAGIGPAQRRSSVDSPHAWAGIYDRRLLDQELLWFDEDLRTCEDRPWLWRLHLHADTFAVVGLYGVRYRRDVGSSLTQIRDDRQFDFIPAFERIVDAVVRHGGSHLNKALRSYCAVICWQLEHTERYPVPLAVELRRLLVDSLAKLPARELDQTLELLDPERARTLTDLRHVG